MVTRAAAELVAILAVFLPLTAVARPDASFGSAVWNARKLINDVDNNNCYDDGDNFEVEAADTTRGDWGKCIPPALFAVVSRDDTDQSARRLYSQLATLHKTYCVHVDITEVTPEMNEALEAFLLRDPPNQAWQLRQKVNKAINEFFRRWNLEAPSEETCQEYTLYTMKMHYDSSINDGVVVFQDVTSRKEDAATDKYKAESLQFCGKKADGTDAGVVCIWTLANPDDKLPADQANGFDNTDFRSDITFPVKASLLDARYQPGGQFKDAMLFRKNQADIAVHCHYTTNSNGALRVFTYQHTLERLYPVGKFAQYCFCDYSVTARVVTQCDCTKDGTRNNNCGAAESSAATAAGFKCNNCGAN